MESPFTKIARNEWVGENALAFAIRDQYPVSEGHTLVIPKRVVATWFEATREEQHALLELVDAVKRQLDEDLRPDGYNVGFNAGEAAGQTVMHLHVHVIPRFRGDMDDPRGGVRHVIPSRGNYLRKVPSLATGGEDDPFARHIGRLFYKAEAIDIVTAFVQASGLRRIAAAVESALSRGACIRILAGDYLEITQAVALEMLYDWEQSSRAEEEAPGVFEARVVETSALPGRTRAFHPKSWRFEGPGFGAAFVGSSNLSLSALDTGIEWNLRVDRDRDSAAYDRVKEAFGSVWALARPLDRTWIAEYAKRAERSRAALPPGEVEPDERAEPPEPHAVQREALGELRDARASGRARGLAVLATGLGKTWLAAFDFIQLYEETGGTPPRLLFIAHRREILRQAAETFRTMTRARGLNLEYGWFLGSTAQLSADVVFASVAKLSRKEHVEKLKAQRFDYVVVDEVHHAAAQSYRRLLGALDPTFMLGLTATPDRADAADVAGLFDDNIVYRAGIADGISIGRLVPFGYHGVKDDIDYETIPWRNKKWDAGALAEKAQTQARMETLWRAWEAHPGTRTLVFCCSIEHADFVRDWLKGRRVAVHAVHSGETSDDRDGSLEALTAGEIDAICAVDVLNEGVDVPSVDRVVMLRPTASNVVFLQQLGRGLRAADGKDAVTVIDFVGNHRVFLERVRKLLSLSGQSTDLRAVLEAAETVELASGCSVEIELEAKEMLSRMFRVSGADQVERAYRELRLSRDERPTAGELYRLNYPPKPLRARYGDWFSFVRSMGDLDEEEERTLDVASAFLAEIEVTDLTKSFKMVMLQVLVDGDGLFEGLGLEELALKSHAILRRSPDLSEDLPERFKSAEEEKRKAWVRYWKDNPIAAWTTASRRGRTWFDVEDGRVRLTGVDRVRTPALDRMATELVDLRLAEYRARKRRGTSSGSSFVCRVLWNKRDPILKLPNRKTHEVPEDWVDVRLPDGRVWAFKFVKEFCNVARPAGANRNRLPDLMRQWFGPQAGQPGTAFEVRFYRSPDGLWIEPMEAQVISLAAARQRIAAYPDLKAAAGHAVDDVENPEQQVVTLPFDRAGPELFAVRVAGTSMDGGKRPLRSGDWAVFRLARDAGVEALSDRVVLAQTPSTQAGSNYQIKRLTRHESGWRLTSDNPSGPTIEPDDRTVIIARLETAILPEDLGPSIGTQLHEHDLADAFGLEALSPRSGRQAGHLFVFIDEKGILTAPDRMIGTLGRPGETAFVLARLPKTEGVWRYLGVGRPIGHQEWRIPEVDFDTWRTWGADAKVSRPLPGRVLERAEIVASTLESLAPEARWIDRPDGRRARVLGRARRGGLRIDGGEEGFAERTVSLVDIGWTLAANDDVRTQGGALNEVRVNKLRYLEGTPKGSTRWIDSGWALAALARAVSFARVPILSELGLRIVHDAQGTPISAKFSVERAGDALTVVVEAKGGKKGTPQERNTDYNQGLELILERLATVEAQITDALVDSETVRTLDPKNRRLQIEGNAYPIQITDAKVLRSALGPAMARVNQKPGTRGGNPTKRLRLFIKTHALSADALADHLEGPAATT